jgi:hypothetical protein
MTHIYAPRNSYVMFLFLLTMNVDEHRRPIVVQTTGSPEDTREDCANLREPRTGLGCCPVHGISEICSVSPDILCNCRKHRDETAEKLRQPCSL